VGRIRISNADSNYLIRNKRQLYNWIEDCIVSERRATGEIEITLCSDTYLLRINNEFLSHNYYTDIITFDYCIGKQVSGELFISMDRIKENALKEGVSAKQELNRVIIHGILHLCGYKDKTKAEKETMRRKENAKLKRIN